MWVSAKNALTVAGKQRPHLEFADSATAAHKTFVSLEALLHTAAKLPIL